MNPTQDIIPILKLALRYHREGNLDYAKYVYQHVLGIDPQNADALHLLGVSVYQSEQYDIAINLITQAIQIDSTKPLFFTNLGNAFQKQGKLEQSAQAYQKAIQIQPDYAEAYFNLGNSLREQGKLKESTQALQKAVQIQPDYADAHFNLAMLLLLQGQFVEGWEKYEWRWDSSLKSQKRNFKRPLWDGTSLSSKSILIYAEQGFGDSIQFVRYIDLFPDTTTIIVACQPELKSLLKRIGRIDTLVTKGEDIPKFDFHAPIVSLPHIFGTVLETIPAKIPYLYPDKNSDFAFLSNDERDLKVGIAWAGSPTHINDRNRSISLNNFKCLLDIKGCEFFSLQVGEHHRDIKRCGYSRIIKDLGKQFTNFHHTASAILQLDLVISVDTAVAHLAGALGKPVWTLLPFIPDWRWMLNRSDSPWYPSMTLFRQRKRGDWHSVFQEIRLTLIQYSQR
ncbi:MAG: tetratricopeptide repeat protein [Candidatus Poribacteria bacterium]|nr:tetratricopeptide repeat protein [Candidatus Poribacteria bacterium]